MSVWGYAGHEGGVGPRAAVSTGGYLVVMSSVWGHLMRSTAVGLSLDTDAERAEPVWARELPLEADHEREIAAQVTASDPSVVSAGDGRVYLVSGGVRLLVASDTGTVVAETGSRFAATGPAVVWGSELLVPEYDHLAAYDRETLAPRWRRRAPGETGIGVAPADGLCPLSRRTSPEGHREALLWDLRDDAVYEVPRAERISSAPVSFGSLAVLSCGGGAGERLIGLSLETGAGVWEAETLPPNPNYFRAPAPAARPVDPAAVAHGELVIAGSQRPTVDARVAADGELVWRLELTHEPDRVGAVTSGQPSALGVFDDTLWVATKGRRLLALDPTSGAVRGEVAELDPKGPDSGTGPQTAALQPSSPENLLEISEGSGSSSVLAVGVLGAIYGVSL